jgi:6-phosphofructokinase 1
MAVFTSGGDAPGMNACIRAVVRSALAKGIRVWGIRNGYEGMIDGDITELTASGVGQIIHRGGTILKSARSTRFMQPEFRAMAASQLRQRQIDGVVAIGGDGTFRGAMALETEHGIRVIGVPGTIDNDLYGTDFTIGYDTAINTVTQAVDKIRDTADSHNRLFIVEVMGRDAGFIALRSGIASGAEAILVPETQTYIERLLERLAHRRREKAGGIIMVAEGDDFGGAMKVADAVRAAYPDFDVRVTVLGHIQRGGNPSAMDRVLASRLGNGAVSGLLEGRSAAMCGQLNGEVVFTPFERATKHHQRVKPDLLELAELLST